VRSLRCVVKHRIGKATGAFEGFRKVWQSEEISIQTKTRLMSVCVMSVLLYAAETWTFKKNDMNRIRSFETKRLRKILNIKWQRKIKNKDIMKRMCTDIMQRMIERKMNFFGHICRMQDERLIKQVVFGIMDGKNKRGRPKIRWTDDLADWCNKDICNLHTLAMDRNKWTHLVKYVVDTNGH